MQTFKICTVSQISKKYKELKLFNLQWQYLLYLHKYYN